MRKVLITTIILVLVLSLGGCGGGTESTTTNAPATTAGSATTADTGPTASGKPYGGVVRIVTTAEGARPIGVPWEVFGVDNALLVPSCETLVFERTNSEIVPFLASDFKVDTAQKEIVFQLNEGIKFHDGTDFNADVAIWNLQQGLEAKVLSSAITGVEKRGDYELAVKFDTYSNDILSSLAGKFAAMISRQAFEANGIEWARDNPVGTGPFKLKTYVRGGSIVFEKNENYWREGEPYLDGMEFRFIRDVMTQNVALQSEGEQSIDVLNTTSGNQIAQFREQGLTIKLLPIGPISLVPSSRDTNSPLSKLEVRQAISYAIDREAIVAARGFGVWTPAYQFIGEEFVGHLPESYNASYDLEKAKELMKQAGYADGFETTLYAQPALADKDAAVAIQSMLSQIGIKARVEYPDTGGYSALRSNGWDGLLVQHTRSLTQIVRTFNYYFGKVPNLLTSMWYPDDMEAAIQAALSQTDNKDELEALSKMVVENQLLVPVYNLMDGWIIKPSVKGGEFTEWGSSTMFMPHQMYIEK